MNILPHLLYRSPLHIILFEPFGSYTHHATWPLNSFSMSFLRTRTFLFVITVQLVKTGHMTLTYYYWIYNSYPNFATYDNNVLYSHSSPDLGFNPGSRTFYSVVTSLSSPLTGNGPSAFFLFLSLMTLAYTLKKCPLLPSNLDLYDNSSLGDSPWLDEFLSECL